MGLPRRAQELQNTKCPRVPKNQETSRSAPSPRSGVLLAGSAGLAKRIQYVHTLSRLFRTCQRRFLASKILRYSKTSRPELPSEEAAQQASRSAPLDMPEQASEGWLAVPRCKRLGLHTLVRRPMGHGFEAFRTGQPLPFPTSN